MFFKFFTGRNRRIISGAIIALLIVAMVICFLPIN